MSEYDRINAKLDILTSMVATLAESLRGIERPMTKVAFARRVGLSRWAVYARCASGEIRTKGGRIPPSELKKFGL